MKLTYPYSLDKDVPFHLETIPVYGMNERIDFFYKYKRKTENLYIGNINKGHLLLRESRSLFESISKYLKRKDFSDSRILDDFSKRLLPKVCWLTDVFYKQGFKLPIAVHWNPRIRANVIHPGSVRNHVIKLFQTTDPVYCLYFNTGGVEFDFMKNLSVFPLTPSNNLEFEMVADHGSIIPHINLDVSSNASSLEKWHEFIYRRLTSPTFSIKSNIDIDILKPWYAPDAKIEIRIENTNNLDDLCRCVILAIIGKSYQSPTLSVKHHIEFSTVE